MLDHRHLEVAAKASAAGIPSRTLLTTLLEAFGRLARCSPAP